MRESDSEIYEDAESKILKTQQSQNNTFSVYQDAQSKKNDISKWLNSKRKESSVYQDAQSKITNLSAQEKITNKFKNSSPKINQEKNLIQLKNEFLQKNNISNDEYNKEINNYSNNGIKDDKINNIFFENKNENEDKENESESVYSDLESGRKNKEMTIFEGASNKGGCCNLPKCFIF